MQHIDTKSSSAPFVDISSVSLRYGEEGTGKLALNDTTLTIGRSEFSAVVGPSGCGKSTLLKLASGLSLPNAGHVRINGVPVTKPTKTSGMAFQNPILLPWRTTLGNIMLPLEVVDPHRKQLKDPAHYKKYVAYAIELLRQVGLTNIENTFPWQLSGGMQQRASLCRALIHTPELLLLDEPFGALDAFTREELWEVLQALWEKHGFTVMLVTHDLTEATYLSDTVHVMSASPGSIVYRLEVDLPRPRTPDMRYTSKFMDHLHELRKHIGGAQAPAGTKS
jgi:NitT/TauT family transport system ATP-binding protein